jgi:hypothetical protein
LVVSNLGEASNGDGSVGSDKWAAQAFVTGGTATTLQNVGLALASDNSALGNYSVSLWSLNPSNGTPGSSLGTITSGNPVSSLTKTLADYFFTLTTPIPLAANTTYFIVLNSTSTAFPDSLLWGITPSSNSTGPGQIGGWAFSTDSGTTWGTVPPDYNDQTTGSGFPFQIGINAVPEPQTYAILFGLGLIGFAIARHVRRPVAQSCAE